MTVESTYPLAGPADPAAPDETGQPVQITQNTAHIASGIDKFIEQYKERPRMASWATSYLDEVQEIEDALWDVLIKRAIDQAADAQLDVLGSIVGQPRRGLSDADYRTFIRARIAVNRSNGRPNELIHILQLIMAGVVEVVIIYQDRPEASIYIQLASDIGTIIAAHVFELLNEARPAGVELQFSWLYGDPDEAFTLATSTAYETSVDLGLGNTLDATDGGELASVIGA
jgi:hypothetical protein